jgi:NAD(P)-dependent dehydrogenase (short-subunit alcohol dehydrogenase family)
MNILEFRNKNIIITGASSGIGRECAIVLSKLGANVILIGRKKNELTKTSQMLYSKSYLIIEQDITIFDKCNEIVEKSVNEFGKISGFIHCAGIEKTLPLRQMKPSHYYDLFNINAISGFELAKIISKKNNHEKISTSFVFISSVMSELGQPGKIGYCSSKGALVAGSRAMALELAKKNIRVNCVLPGMVKTEMFENIFNTLPIDSQNSITNMHPLGLGKPDDVANMCVFLLSDLSKWITGTNFRVDGGYSAQ